MKVTRGDGLIEGFERLNQTIRDEYSVAFLKKLYTTPEEIQANLDASWCIITANAQIKV